MGLVRGDSTGEDASGAEGPSQALLALKLGEYEWRRPDAVGFSGMVKPNLIMLVRFDITEPIEIDDIELFVAGLVKTPVAPRFSLAVSDSHWIKFHMSSEINETLHASSMRVHANGQWFDSPNGLLIYPTL